jgi:hypothetical protein
MYFISATRLRVKSIFFLPSFFISNEASLKELKVTKGFIEGKELVDKKLTFWTLTLWESDGDMRAFRNSVPHRKAMQQLPNWCDEASYTHWMQEEKSLPDWTTVYNKMITEGKTTKVRKPSANQTDKSYPLIKWIKTERPLKRGL